MKQKTLTFGQPENITQSGDDAVTYRFPFSAVDSDALGSPEEDRVTTQHRVTVQATRSRLAAWSLPEADLIKELFEIGKREILDLAAKGPLKPDEFVAVSTVTHDAVPPFDPSRIPDPGGQAFTVEPAPRRIGF